jgi:hypothetical protein
MWQCSKCGESLKDVFEVCWACGTSKDGVQDPHFLDPEAEAAPENQALEAIPDDLDVEEEPERMVTVANCNLAAQAHAMRMRLEAAGIPVFLADELTIAMDWLLSNAIGGVKVQVAERHAPRAAEILDEFSRTVEQNREDDDGEKE